MPILDDFRMPKASFIVLLITFSTICQAVDGPGSSGGGNTVGDTLFDDYENKGSVAIPQAEITRLADPVLRDLDRKVPDFAKRLRKGIQEVVWYREPKLLDQSGACRNGSDTGLTPPVNQVVRACQNSLSVRIEKNWIDEKLKSNPELVSGLVVHELLVHQRLRSKKISEEAVLRISRDIRSKQLTDKELQAELKIAQFGNFQTLPEAIQSAFNAPEDKLKILCISVMHSTDENVRSGLKDLEISIRRFDELADVAEGKLRSEAQMKKSLLDRLLRNSKGSGLVNECRECGNLSETPCEISLKEMNIEVGELENGSWATKEDSENATTVY